MMDCVCGAYHIVRITASPVWENMSQRSCIILKSKELYRNFPLRSSAVRSPSAIQENESLSTRHVEELMLERGAHVDHSTVNRWVINCSPQLEEAFHYRVMFQMS